MALSAWFERSDPQPGAPGLRTLNVSHSEWRQAIGDLAAADVRLVAMWASRDGAVPVPAASAVHEASPAQPVATVHAMFLARPGGLTLNLRHEDPHAPYPGLETLFPCAARMQRALADLSGLHSTATDTRPWLRHAAWASSYRPLMDSPETAAAASGAAASDAAAAPATAAPAIEAYEFVRVEGEGVHEIAVGPVHAGSIEPGHFRCTVVGEKVLKLEERFGYAHKGIELRFTQLPILEGHRLAARVSGDSAVAFSWAYCQALEGSAGMAIPSRAAWLRALGLELERIANHLGDIGALGNDAGFAFGQSQFSRLKEYVLRATQEALGARYLMDFVVPGGTRVDITDSGIRILDEVAGMLEQEIPTLRTIYDEHEGVRDRFTGTGTVTAELAQRLGLTGLAGRASGQAYDLRADLPCAPYTALAPVKCTRTAGDVGARVAVRFDELQESCRLLRRILEMLPAGPHIGDVSAPADGAVGVGLIEGWRGPVLVALHAGPEGTIRRCHPHDPSWQNWPVIEHAIIGNIIADLPIINKSFNLAYSGHDL